MHSARRYYARRGVGDGDHDRWGSAMSAPEWSAGAAVAVASVGVAAAAGAAACGTWLGGRDVLGTRRVSIKWL